MNKCWTDFGLAIAGLIADRWNYMKTVPGAPVALTGAIFLMFFAQDIIMLHVGEVLCGIPWDSFQPLTSTCVAEVSPIVLRPYLTTYVNLCWVAGQFIAAGIACQ
jgi:SP family general alpha glucoside:H+ symporter-like MFS transporter